MHPGVQGVGPIQNEDGRPYKNRLKNEDLKTTAKRQRPENNRRYERKVKDL